MPTRRTKNPLVPIHLQSYTTCDTNMYLHPSLEEENKKHTVSITRDKVLNMNEVCGCVC